MKCSNPCRCTIIAATSTPHWNLFLYHLWIKKASGFDISSRTSKKAREFSKSQTKSIWESRLSQRLCLLYNRHSSLIHITVLGITSACTAVTCDHMMEWEIFSLPFWPCLASSLHKSAHTHIQSGIHCFSVEIIFCQVCASDKRYLAADEWNGKIYIYCTHGFNYTSIRYKHKTIWENITWSWIYTRMVSVYYTFRYIRSNTLSFL